MAFHLVDLQTLLQEELRAVDTLILDSSKDRIQPIGSIIHHLLMSGGKRLRPMLVILGAKLFGYTGERHIRMAAVVEFIHSATLLHDDVVDNSSLRRGQPTACSIWGNQTSVLVGDYLLSQAFQWMVRDGSLPILQLLSDTSATIAEGEVLQMTAMHEAGLHFDTYHQIIHAKTAALFAAACQIGALITEQPTPIVQAMADYGAHLGTAFQMMDDILDYTAKEAELGKSLGDDFREGKVTLPVIVAYQQASAEDQQALTQLFTPEAAENPDSWTQLQTLLTRYDASTKSAHVITDYVARAKASLAAVPTTSARQWLEDVLDFVANRCY